MFSKKATKIDEILTVTLTLFVKSTVKILSIFVAFLENMNFKQNPEKNIHVDLIRFIETLKNETKSSGSL